MVNIAHFCQLRLLIFTMKVSSINAFLSHSSLMILRWNLSENMAARLSWTRKFRFRGLLIV